MEPRGAGGGAYFFLLEVEPDNPLQVMWNVRVDHAYLDTCVGDTAFPRSAESDPREDSIAWYHESDVTVGSWPAPRVFRRLPAVDTVFGLYDVLENRAGAICFKLWERAQPGEDQIFTSLAPKWFVEVKYASTIERPQYLRRDLELDLPTFPASNLDEAQMIHRPSHMRLSHPHSRREPRTTLDVDSNSEPEGLFATMPTSSSGSLASESSHESHGADNHRVFHIEFEC